MNSEVKDKEFRVRFGYFLKYHLEQSGLTQKEVASRIDIDPANLSRIMAGKYSPSFELVAAIARVLNITSLPIYKEQLPF